MSDASKGNKSHIQNKVLCHRAGRKWKGWLQDDSANHLHLRIDCHPTAPTRQYLRMTHNKCTMYVDLHMMYITRHAEMTREP